MARTLIFYHPRNRELAEARRARIPGAQVRSLKGWNGRVEEPAEHVIVDDAPDVVAAYRAGGARVEALIGRVPEPEPDPEPEVEDEAPSLPHGYEVVQSGTWYKVIGPDGEQVGNAKRSEAEAIAQVSD